MKVGQTIAEKRERLQSESERLRAREQVKKKQTVSTTLFVVAVLALFGVIVFSAKQFLDRPVVEETTKVSYEPKVKITDESGAGISERTKEFVGKLEADLGEKAYTVSAAAVPAGKSREVDVHLQGIDYYFKVNIDRDAAETAEDIARMVGYLEEKGEEPGYVDVRVERKAYYK